MVARTFQNTGVLPFAFQTQQANRPTVGHHKAAASGREVEDLAELEGVALALRLQEGLIEGKVTRPEGGDVGVRSCH